MWAQFVLSICNLIGFQWCNCWQVAIHTADWCHIKSRLSWSSILGKHPTWSNWICGPRLSAFTHQLLQECVWAQFSFVATRFCLGLATFHCHRHLMCFLSTEYCVVLRLAVQVLDHALLSHINSYSCSRSSPPPAAMHLSLQERNSQSYQQEHIRTGD